MMTVMITTVTTLVRLLPDPVDFPLDDPPDPFSIITLGLPPLPGQGLDDEPFPVIVLCATRIGNAESAAVIRTNFDRQISPLRPALATALNRPLAHRPD